jgi:hypothetical protein
MAWVNGAELSKEAVMHKAKAFFFVCAGIFLLALSYHLGATSAVAQATGNSVVTDVGPGTVITSNGDVYVAPSVVSAPGWYANWTRVGNVFGAPTPALARSWGQVKVEHR